MQQKNKKQASHSILLSLLNNFEKNAKVKKNLGLVQGRRLELLWIAPLVPKTSAYTNSANPASICNSCFYDEVK